MSAWLDSVVYHSFLRYSVEGSERCWCLHEVKGHGYDETLPLGLKLTLKFHNTTEWIILKHGPRVLPVEIVNEKFRRGWPEFHSAHGLQGGYKIMLGCERRWIFDAIIFDENDTEVRYRWSSRGFDLKNLHPPSNGIRTACLPSTLQSQRTAVKFVILYGPRVELIVKFEERLLRMIEFFELREIIVRMAHRIWTVPVESMRLEPVAFDQFVAALELEYADYIMVAVSPALELQVVVIGIGPHREKHYDWMRN